ncbi:MAG: ERCC4 domain-containing protein [Nanoarchaeota archaeon]
MPFFDIFSGKKEKEKEEIKVIVDFREKNSLVASELMKRGIKVEFKQLPIGDYIVNGVVIERKTISDFKSSIVDKRIISQLLELKQYEKHLLILEGVLDEEMYSGGIHENAFRGFLLSVALEYNVPIIFTHNAEDSAKYIDVLARRKEKAEAGIRASKILMSRKEQMQFILEGFPHVGPAKAKKLIEKFGSLRDIFNASEEELKEILGKRAKEFRELISRGDG